MNKAIIVLSFLVLFGGGCATEVAAPTDNSITPTTEVTLELTPEITSEPTPTLEVYFPTPVPLRYAVNSSTANYFIRTGPGVEHEKVLWPDGSDRKLLSGDEVGVDCYSQTENWIQVYDPIEGYVGWVSKFPLEIQGECVYEA